MSNQSIVARQAIFDTSRQIIGYELLHRTTNGINRAYIDSGYVATTEVIAHGIDLIVNSTHPHQKLFINFPRRCLEEKQYLHLNKNRYVLEIAASEVLDTSFLELVKTAKAYGYKIALDDVTRYESVRDTMHLLDYVKVDYKKLTDPVEMEQLSRHLRSHDCFLLAERVETPEIMDLARTLHYDYFQGYFYCKPQLFTQKTLPASTTSRINLLFELNKKNVDYDRLVKIIDSDPILAFKLLKFVNSPFLGQQTKTTSIKRALAILGLDELTHWINILYLSTLCCTDRDKEILYLSAFRARFLNLLRKTLPSICGMPFDSCLPGLFCFLDALLNTSFEKIFDQLHGCEDVRDCLVDNNSKCHQCFKLINYFENNNLLQIAGFKRRFAAINIDHINLDAHMWATCVVR